MLIGAAFVTPASIANGRMTYGAHDQYQGQARQATVSAAQDIIGVNKGLWVVANGKGQIISDQAQSLEALGGPGTLIVQDGNAAILEKVGQFSRTVNSGLTQLEAYERVAMIVPLTLRSEHLYIKNVATADKILIEEFELWAFHKVLASDPASAGASATTNTTSPAATQPSSTFTSVSPTPGAVSEATPSPSAPGSKTPTTGATTPNPVSIGANATSAGATPPILGAQPRFTFDEDILLNRVWTMSGNDWRDSVRNVVETATRDVVGRHTVEEILPLAGAGRLALKAELLAAINRVTCDLMGVQVTAVDFGEMRIPTEVRDSLQAKLVAGWRADTAETEVREARARTEAEAVHLRRLEAERAVAQHAMMVAIAQGITEIKSVDPSVLLNMRLIEALEKMAENPATKFVIPTDVLQLLEHMRPGGSIDAERAASPAAPSQFTKLPDKPNGDGASAGEVKPA